MERKKPVWKKPVWNEIVKLDNLTKEILKLKMQILEISKYRRSLFYSENNTQDWYHWNETDISSPSNLRNVSGILHLSWIDLCYCKKADIHLT